MRLFTALCCIAVLAGCGSNVPGGPTGPVDTQVTLGPGQTANVPDAAIRLHFQQVVNDSRCPGDVLCITGGDALVRIDVQSATGDETTYDLHTATMQPVRHNELTIALVELNPYPFLSRPISPDQYRATFRITR